MRRGLIGDHVGNETALHERGEHVGAIADQPDRQGCAATLGIGAPGERFVHRGGGPVEVAAVQAPLHAGRIDLHREADAVVHRGGEGLRAAHPA